MYNYQHSYSQVFATYTITLNEIYTVLYYNCFVIYN